MTTLATRDFERYVAEQTANRGSVAFDEMIFANIPNLTAGSLVNHLRIPATNHIVHRQPISQAGVVNENAVVYSVTMGTEVGDFDFNFIGLINRSRNLLAVAVYTDTIKKTKNRNGVQGNSITRSILLQFTGAKQLTNLSVSAETWQIDFTSRLRGLDEKIRLTNRDLYGRAIFFDDGFKVTRGTGNQYFVEVGSGYIEGERAENKTRQTLTVRNLPCSIYVDLVHHCTVTGAYQTDLTFLQANKNDWVDSAGYQHYVQILADIDRNGAVTDQRILDGRYIPNSKKSNAINSDSRDTVATSFAVKTAYDLAASKQSPATTLAGYGITNAMRVDADNKNINLATLLGQNTVWGTAGRERSVIGLLSNIYNYGVGLSISASGGQALIYVPHSSANDNKGVWVMSAYAGNSAAPAWRRIDGTDWEDIRNPVNASTTRRGLAQYTDNVNFDSSDWGASAKALRTVNIKAENANNNANGRVSKNGDTMNSLGINSGHRITAYQYAYGSYAQQKDSEAPFFVREHNANGSNAYFPALKTRVRNGDGWTANFSFGYTTPNGRNQWGEGAILLNEDNGHHRYWRFKHNGDFHSAADVVADNGYRLKNTHQIGQSFVQVTTENYGGVKIERTARNDRILIESSGENLDIIRRNRATNGTIAVVKIPLKNLSSTVVLNTEFVGQVAYFAMSNPPTGWLKANGAAVSRTTYASLFDRIGTRFGAGDGRTTFNLPDLRGEFVRGWDDGRNVDAGRAFGSHQGDAIRNITGHFEGASNAKAASGAFFYQGGGYSATGDGFGKGVHFNASRVVPTANENRPRNIALLACIKY